MRALHAASATRRATLAFAVACASCAALVGIEDKEPFPPLPEAAAEDSEPDTDAGATFVPVVETMVSGQRGLVGLSIDDGYVYFTSEIDGAVYRIVRTGGPVEVVARDQHEPRELLGDGQRIYWHNSNAKGLADAGAVGEVMSYLRTSIGTDAGPTPLSTTVGVSRLRVLAATPAADSLLVASYVDRVQRFRVGVPNDAVVQDDAGALLPSAVGSDEAYFYWFQNGTADMWRRYKNYGTPTIDAGHERIVALPAGTTVKTMTLEGTSFFFVTGAGAVMRYDTSDGGAPSALASGFAGVNAIAADPDRVYFTRGDTGGEVVMVPRAGGAPVVLAKDQDRPRGIAVRAGYVHWVTYGDGALRRVEVR